MVDIKNYILNREWAVAIGVIATLVTSGEELLESLSIIATENNDWSPLGLVPLVAAVVIRTRVWAQETIVEIEKEIQA
jgi:hypothetical protein